MITLFKLKRTVCLSLLIWTSLVSVYAQTQDSYAIEGTILLDSLWSPVVYLSQIPTYKDMYTMSSGMIVAEARLDARGIFKFPSEYFPNEDQLYRLHISKKDAPAASLIIGGPEENHFFLIANGSSQVQLKSSDTIPPFGTITISGYKPSLDLQKIDALVAYLDSTNFEEATLKGEFVQKAIQEKLRQVADSSSHPLVSLYALYQSNFETNYPVNSGYYERYLNKWEDQKSPYFDAFRNHFPQKSSKSYLYWLIGLVFFLLGLTINRFIRKRKTQSNGDLLKELSVQERKIFDLIREGKSNKDISEACNIGVSTVKSHVSNIYGKLGIHSRKEAMDY